MPATVPTPAGTHTRVADVAKVVPDVELGRWRRPWPAHAHEHAAVALVVVGAVRRHLRPVAGPREGVGVIVHELDSEVPEPGADFVLRLRGELHARVGAVVPRDLRDVVDMHFRAVLPGDRADHGQALVRATRLAVVAVHHLDELRAVDVLEDLRSPPS